MTVLVTGGAGYVGAHVVRALVERYESVVVVDDLSTGRYDRLPDVEMFRVDLANPSASRELAMFMKHRGVDSVMHLAGLKKARTDAEAAGQFFAVNVAATSYLLDAMTEANVPRIVFASSAAVYGQQEGALLESATPMPASPYGQSKLDAERRLLTAHRTFGISVAILRLFNVVGAQERTLIDRTDGALLPAIWRSLNKSDPFVINGNGYPTPDGTCVRDFVDVSDVAEAFLSARRRLVERGGVVLANIGTAHGTSVSEVVREVSSATGRRVLTQIGPARAEDVPTSTARIEWARESLGWGPMLSFRDSIRAWVPLTTAP